MFFEDNLNKYRIVIIIFGLLTFFVVSFCIVLWFFLPSWEDCCMIAFMLSIFPIILAMLIFFYVLETKTDSFKWFKRKADQLNLADYEKMFCYWHDDIKFFIFFKSHDLVEKSSRENIVELRFLERNFPNLDAFNVESKWKINDRYRSFKCLGEFLMAKPLKGEEVQEHLYGISNIHSIIVTNKRFFYGPHKKLDPNSKTEEYEYFEKCGFIRFKDIKKLKVLDGGPKGKGILYFKLKNGWKESILLTDTFIYPEDQKKIEKILNGLMKNS